MTKRTTPPTNGVPTWIDYMARDTTATGQFFTDLFGWDVPPGDPAMGGYATATVRGGAVSGLGPAWDDSMPDVQAVYLATNDIHTTIARAKAAGATFMNFGEDGSGDDHEVMVVAEHGSMATFTDPSGATIGLWQANTMIGFGVENETGAPTWFELVTRDVEAAKTFYGDVFGFTFERSESDLDDTEYYEAQLGTETIFGIMAAPADLPEFIPSYWIGYYQTDDAQDCAEVLQRLGGQLIAGPGEIEDGTWMNATTPGGAMFGVFAPVKRDDVDRFTSDETLRTDAPVGV